MTVSGAAVQGQPGASCYENRTKLTALKYLLSNGPDKRGGYSPLDISLLNRRRVWRCGLHF